MFENWQNLERASWFLLLFVMKQVYKYLNHSFIYVNALLITIIEFQFYSFEFIQTFMQFATYLLNVSTQNELAFCRFHFSQTMVSSE